MCLLKVFANPRGSKSFKIFKNYFIASHIRFSLFITFIILQTVMLL